MHAMVPAEQHRHIPTETSYVFDGTKRRPRTELPMDVRKRESRNLRRKRSRQGCGVLVFVGAVVCGAGYWGINEVRKIDLSPISSIFEKKETMVFPTNTVTTKPTPSDIP